MKELIKITENAIDAEDLYDFLEIKHKFSDWIRNSIKDYGFKDGKDFVYYFRKSTGGRPAKKYAISINMAKELAMVSKTEKGKKARDYFIKCEDIAKKSYVVRLAGVETRKLLTDKIKESNENERMHGHGYRQYTKLAYKLCGIEYEKQDNFRDTLNPEQLKNVKTVETMIGSMLDLGKEYGEIKDSLSPIFKELSEGSENG